MRVESTYCTGREYWSLSWLVLDFYEPFSIKSSQSTERERAGVEIEKSVAALVKNFAMDFSRYSPGFNLCAPCAFPRTFSSQRYPHPAQQEIYINV
jgi:hypothetical protein